MFSHADLQLKSERQEALVINGYDWLPESAHMFSTCDTMHNVSHPDC
jgi:hypothetical protein